MSKAKASQEATISRASFRLRRLFGLLSATILMPLAMMFLGLWEQERGTVDWADLDAERIRLTSVVAQLEMRAPRDGRIDFQMQFRRNGKTFVGPLALTEARDARDEVATLANIMGLRRLLPLAVIGAAGFAAGLSVLVLVTAGLLGWLGRTSREILVRGFASMRLVLPVVLAAQVVLATMAFVTAVIFEAAALAQPGIGTGEAKLLGVAGIAVIASIVLAGSTLLGLRRALAAFEPDPLSVLGRPVSAAEAPGLWRLVEGLAQRLDALKPAAIVVGLTEGFFVSAGQKVLQPGGGALSGRTLYIPLPYLPLLRADEVASIIGHELAHFAGGDTAYSLRFLPIYAGVGRSLDAVAQAGGGNASLGLLSPAMRLGSFVMDQFHHAVRHWSRAREFAADRASAGPTSPEAAARALLRTGAIHSTVAKALKEAADNADAAPADLVAAVLDRAIANGFDDPAAGLEIEPTHPTDTHPPTRERIAALGCALTPDLVAAAAMLPPREALGGLAAYFADPAGLCRAATSDFLTVVRRHDQAFQAHLQAKATDIGTQERVLIVNRRAAGFAFLAVAAPILFTSLFLFSTGVPGVGAQELQLTTAAGGALGAVVLGCAVFFFWQGKRTSLVLRPESLIVPGLDRPIAWDDVADMDMTLRNGGVVTRLLLPPDAPFPQRSPGGRKVKLDAERRIVTIMVGLPGKMKPQDFADLIARYRQAAEARRLLAGKATPSPLAGSVQAG